MSVTDPEVVDILLPGGDHGAAVQAPPVLAPRVALLGDVVVLQLQPLVEVTIVNYIRYKTWYCNTCNDLLSSAIVEPSALLTC